MSFKNKTLAYYCTKLYKTKTFLFLKLNYTGLMFFFLQKNFESLSDFVLTKKIKIYLILKLILTWYFKFKESKFI